MAPQPIAVRRGALDILEDTEEEALHTEVQLLDTEDTVERLVWEQ